MTVAAFAADGENGRPTVSITVATAGWRPAAPADSTRAEGASQPAENAALADSLSLAFLILLENLTPTERAVFILREVLENFEGRHRNLIDIFEARAMEMEDALEPHAQLSKTQRRLIGAYFLNEYSFEASALFNPSIVRHPDQTGAPENGCRFILGVH